MSCNCNNENLISKSDVTASLDSTSSATKVILTTSVTLDPINESRVAIRLIGSVPTGGNVLPVYVSFDGGTTSIPVYDKFGNILYGYGIRPYAIMKGYFGNNGESGTSHLQLINYPYYRQPKMRTI